MHINNKAVIDIASGSITSEHSKDKAILFGTYPFEGNSYIDNIELILDRKDNSSISIKFPYSGYSMQLFVTDFTNDKKSEVMVRGAFGGSGGFEIGVIYRYEDGKLVEIFDQNKFYKDNPCVAEYKPNYNVQINCGDKVYSIDISSREKDYLNEIYNSDGSIKANYQPYVDAPYAIYPVKSVYSNYYGLLIQQRVVGIANSDTLGVIQTLVTLVDGKLETVYKGLLLLPY